MAATTRTNPLSTSASSSQALYCKTLFTSSKQLRAELTILTVKSASSHNSSLWWTEGLEVKTKHLVSSSKIYCNLRWWSQVKQVNLLCNSRASRTTTKSPQVLRTNSTPPIIRLLQPWVCWTNSARAVNHLFLSPILRWILLRIKAREKFLRPIAIMFSLSWTTFLLLETLCRISFSRINLLHQLNYRTARSHSKKSERYPAHHLATLRSKLIRRREIISMSKSNSSTNTSLIKM